MHAADFRNLNANTGSRTIPDQEGTEMTQFFTRALR